GGRKDLAGGNTAHVYDSKIGVHDPDRLAGMIESGSLGCDSVGFHPIVTIQHNDVSAPEPAHRSVEHGRQPDIALGSDNLGWQIVVRNPVIDSRSAPVPRTVVGDDELEIWLSLGGNAVERLLDPLFLVEARHNHGRPWCRLA